jgi:hypothetical protein
MSTRPARNVTAPDGGSALCRCRPVPVQCRAESRGYARSQTAVRRSPAGQIGNQLSFHGAVTSGPPPDPGVGRHRGKAAVVQPRPGSRHKRELVNGVVVFTQEPRSWVNASAAMALTNAANERRSSSKSMTALATGFASGTGHLLDRQIGCHCLARMKYDARYRKPSPFLGLADHAQRGFSADFQHLIVIY